MLNKKQSIFVNKAILRYISIITQGQKKVLSSKEIYVISKGRFSRKLHQKFPYRLQKLLDILFLSIKHVSLLGSFHRGKFSLILL